MLDHKVLTRRPKDVANLLHLRCPDVSNSNVAQYTGGEGSFRGHSVYWELKGSFPLSPQVVWEQSDRDISVLVPVFVVVSF